MELSGYTPGAGGKSCAHFASWYLRQKGYKLPLLMVTTEFWPYTTPVKAPQPDDLVFFNRTYDALPPSGIGPEDTYTHVGVMTGPDEFVHFSASQMRPVHAKLGPGWEVAEFARIKPEYRSSHKCEIHLWRSVARAKPMIRCTGIQAGEVYEVNDFEFTGSGVIIKLQAV